MYTKVAIKLVDDDQVGGRADASRLTSFLAPRRRFSASFSSEFRD